MRSSTTESAQTRALCHGLRECGALVKSHVGNRMQGSGWPDRWICHPMWQGHLEFKGEHGKLSTIQRRMIDEINIRQPGSAFVARFCDEGIVIESSNGARLAVVPWSNWREMARETLRNLARLRREGAK